MCDDRLQKRYPEPPGGTMPEKTIEVRPENTIEVTEKVMQTLEDLAKRKKTSVGAVLKEAIGLEITLTEVSDKGGRMLLEQNGRLREIIPIQGVRAD
jgi:hypothetical protein